MKKYIQLAILACASASLMLTVGCATGARCTAGAPKTLINSEPSGAAVFVNESFVGKAPQTMEFSPRKEYKIRMELPGYLPYSTISAPSVDFLGGASMYAGDTAMVAICPPAGVVAYGVDFFTKDSKRHPDSIIGKLTPLPYQAPAPATAFQPPPQAPLVAAQTYQPPQTPPPAPVVAQAPPAPAPVMYHAPPVYVAPDPSHNLPAARNDTQ